MYTALRAASITLREFISSRLIADPILGDFFDGTGPITYEVSLNSPQELVDLQSQGLSVWLYYLERDAERLNAPPERVSYNQLRRTPLPLRLHYLMTPILSGDNPETEQLILGKVLQILHDRSTLRGADLRDSFTGTDVELNIRMESVSLEQVSEMFDALDQPYQLAVSYEVSVVLIETDLEPEIGPPVAEVITEAGVIVERR